MYDKAPENLLLLNNLACIFNFNLDHELWDSKSQSFCDMPSTTSIIILRK